MGGPSDRTAIADAALRSRKRNGGFWRLLQQERADLLRALSFVSNDHVLDPYTTGEFASISEAEAFAKRCGDLLYRLTAAEERGDR